MFNFDQNFNNKLSCNVFTTLRLTTQYQINDTVKISLQNKFLAYVEVIDKLTFTSISEVPPVIFTVDTGLEYDKAIPFFKSLYAHVLVDFETQPVYLYVLRHKKMPEQASIDANQLTLFQ